MVTDCGDIVLEMTEKECVKKRYPVLNSENGTAQYCVTVSAITVLVWSFTAFSDEHV